MTLVADVLMIAGALGAAVYCYVLSRKLSRFTNLENGMGGAVAVLSMQVDEMNKALEQARTTAQNSAESLDALTTRAEAAANRIELMLASVHDLEDGSRPATTSRHARTVRRRNRKAESGPLEPAE